MARKTFRKKTSAKRAAHGRTVYKVKHGWRLSCSSRKHRRNHGKRR